MNEEKIRKAVHKRLDDELYWGRKITTDQIINITIAQIKKITVEEK